MISHKPKLSSFARDKLLSYQLPDLEADSLLVSRKCCLILGLTTLAISDSQRGVHRSLTDLTATGSIMRQQIRQLAPPEAERVRSRRLSKAQEDVVLLVLNTAVRIRGTARPDAVQTDAHDHVPTVLSNLGAFIKQVVEERCRLHFASLAEMAGEEGGQAVLSKRPIAQEEELVVDSVALTATREEILRHLGEVVEAAVDTLRKVDALRKVTNTSCAAERRRGHEVVHRLIELKGELAVDTALPFSHGN